MMIEIKHKVSGKVLLVVDADTLQEADLQGANLQGAILYYVNLGETKGLDTCNLTDIIIDRKEIQSTIDNNKLLLTSSKIISPMVIAPTVAVDRGSLSEQLFGTRRSL